MTNDDKKMKIKLFETHFAWVQSSLLDALHEVIGGSRKRTQWIKDCAKEDFNIELDSSSDIPKLDMMVRLHFYEDKGEWLKERMRKTIKAHRDTKPH